MAKSFEEQYAEFQKELNKNQTSTSAPKAKGSLASKIKANNGKSTGGTVTTTTVSAPAATAPASNLKTKAQNIQSQMGAAIRNGGIRPVSELNSGYQKYNNLIESLEKSGAPKEEIRKAKAEFQKYKTDTYYKKQDIRKNNLLTKAENDPDFEKIVKAGEDRYNLVKNASKNSMRLTPIAGINTIVSKVSGLSKLDLFNDDEKKTYLYLLGKEGWTAADSYEKLIERDVNKRVAEAETQGFTDLAKKNKVAGAALYPFYGMVGGLALADTLKQGVQSIGKKDEDFVPAQNTSPMFMGPRVRAAIQEGLTSDIDSPVGQFLAQSGLSAEDFLLTSALGGGQAGSLGLMGMNAGGTGAYEAIERGATPGQAALMGLVNAAAEIAFERVPVGKLGEIMSGEGKTTFLKALLSMAKEEGLEELATEYANMLGDQLIMGNNSEVYQYFANQVKEGKSTEDAKKATIKEFVAKRPGLAFLGGAVSGAGIGAAGAGVGRINYNNSYNQLVNAIETQTGATKEDARKMANDIVSRLSENQNAETETQQEGPVQTEERVPERVTENVPAENERKNLVQMDVDEFNRRHGWTGKEEDFRNWLARDMEKNGIPEEYQNEPAKYVEDIMSDFEGELRQEYANSRGGSIEDIGRDAIQKVLARDGRVSYVPAQETQTGQEQTESRLWTRAAEEQAAYDAEYERTHPQAGIDANAESIPENAGINTENDEKKQQREEAIQEYERAKQEEVLKNAVIKKAVNGFHEKFGRITQKYKKEGNTGLTEAFTKWVTDEISRKGIPEAFRENPKEYAEYLAWNIEQRAKENYKSAKGSTVEEKMRNALQKALGEFASGEADTGVNPFNLPEGNRISARAYLAENPEGAEDFFSENYGGETEDIWGTDILKNRDEGTRREKLGQAFEISKRQLQRAEDEIRKAKKRYGDNYFTKTEKSNAEALVNAILSSVGSNDDGVRRNIVDNVLNQLNRNEPRIMFADGSAVKISPKSDRSILSAMLPYIVEHDYLSGEYQGTSGDLQIRAQEKAKEAVNKLDLSGQDKKMPIFYYTEATNRNWEDVFKKDPDAAKWFNENYTKPQAQNNQKMVQMENKVFDDVRDLGIDTGKKKTYHLEFTDKKGNYYNDDYNESGVLQIYGEKLIDDAKLESLTDKKGNKIDAEKIKHAKDVISVEYEKLLKSINNVLVEYGYTPSLEITDYFPHYNEQSVSAWENVMSMLGFDTDIQDLPTEIAGRTGTWKPGKQWFGNILERQGGRTQFDAIGGFQKYVKVAGNIIYHTGDVQRLRALGNTIRSNYGSSLYQSQLRQLQESRIRGSITPDEYYDTLNKLNEENEGRLTRFNNLVKWIDESANLQAGKQSFLDRAIENTFSRKSLGKVQNIFQRISRNMVGGNVSSSVTNIIPWVQDDTGAKYKLQGLRDTLTTGLKRDGFVNDSAFLTNRFGVEPLVATKLDNFVNKAGFLMETIDRITAEGLVRARYYQNLDAGMDAQSAMDDADDHVARVMADRTRGQAPTIFDVKNPFIKPLTMFQTEIKNQYSWMFKDLPRQNRDKALGVLTAGLFKLIIGSFIYNEVSEKITGRRAATDFADIAWTILNDFAGRERANLFDVAFAGEDLYHPKETTPAEAREEAYKRIMREVPFIGNIAGGGRIPVLEALPDRTVINDNIDAAGESMKARQKILKELIKPAAYILPPTGGIQAKKIYEGLDEYLQGGSYVYDKDNNKQLRYPVEQNAETLIKNALFGRTASQGYQDWKRNGMKNLNARQTENYPKVVRAGIKYDTYMKAIYSLTGKSSKGEQARAIYDLPGVSSKQKQILWESAVRKDYASKGEQPDFSMKKSEFYDIWKDKKQDILDAGVSEDVYDQCVDALKETSTKWEKARAIYDMAGVSSRNKKILWENMTDYKGEAPDFTEKKKEFYNTWKGEDDK